MNTIIYTSVLGFICMVAEILNLRKVIIPVAVIGLAAILGLTVMEWGTTATHFNDMVRTDNFSVAFGSLAIIITGLVIALSSDYYKNEQNHISDYMAIIVFTLVGGLVLLSYSNMAMLFLGIEILSISLYVMAGSRKYNTSSNEAGLKYFLMGSFASGFLLFGIALIYGVTGSFHLEAINTYLASATAVSPLFYLGVLMLLVAILFKVSAAPFHFWSPDVYEGSPALITALMATLVKVVMFGAFYRLFSTAFGNLGGYTNWLIALVAALTMVVGNLTALQQVNVKRLLAFSGIAHAGYLLLGILSITTDATSALFYYSAAYALATIAAFAVAIPVFQSAGSELVSAFNGLGKRKPFMAAMLTMALISLAGIPPFAGFLAKYYIFSEAMANGFFALLLIAIVSSIIGVYYYFKLILAMYTQPTDESVDVKFPTVYVVVAVLCVLLSLALGLYPNPVIQLF